MLAAKTGRSRAASFKKTLLNERTMANFYVCPYQIFHEPWAKLTLGHTLSTQFKHGGHTWLKIMKCWNGSREQQHISSPSWSQSCKKRKVSVNRKMTAIGTIDTDSMATSYKIISRRELADKDQFLKTSDKHYELRGHNLKLNKE